MKLENLLTKKVIVLSGKGGVGRTTLSLVLALWASNHKKNVCLVEMSSMERIAAYFGLEALGYSELALAPWIAGIHLNPRDCFEEYIIRQIRFKALFDAFVNNKFVTYFLDAVPGFNELLMIGKIHDLAKKRKATGTQKEYDLIIVDGPATGHGVSAFEVPQIVNRAVRVGPLRNQSDAILKLIQDPEQCVFCPVTLGEEMPVQECLEMIPLIEKKLKATLGPVFMNQYMSHPFEPDELEMMRELKQEGAEKAYTDYATLRINKSQMHEHYLKQLKKECELVIPVPFMPNMGPGLEGLKKLSEVLN